MMKYTVLKTSPAVHMNTIDTLKQRKRCDEFKPNFKENQNPPHAFGWVVLEVLQELWHSKHCFSGERKKAENLDEHGELKKGEGQRSRYTHKQTHELHVAAEVRPVPKVTQCKIWKWHKKDNLRLKRRQNKRVLLQIG